MTNQEKLFIDWLKTDQPRVDDHQFFKIHEGRLEQMTLRKAFLMGAESQRRMTARTFNIKLGLAVLEARQAKAEGK